MFGVELDGVYWTRVVNDPFIGFVVLVGEENRPIGRQGLCINCEAMVLCRDEAPPSCGVCAWLIVTTVTIPETHKARICTVVYHNNRKDFFKCSRYEVFSR